MEAAQRSFIRYLDVTFTQANGIQEIINSLVEGTTDRIALTRYDLSGQNPVNVPLAANLFSLQTVDDLA